MHLTENYFWEADYLRGLPCPHITVRRGILADCGLVVFEVTVGAFHQFTTRTEDIQLVAIDLKVDGIRECRNLRVKEKHRFIWELDSATLITIDCIHCTIQNI